MCIDAVYLYTAFTARKYRGTVVGPYEFPKYLGIALAVLCILIIIRSLAGKKEEGKFTIQNFDLVLCVIAATALLLILWSCFGIFYLWGFLYVFGLFVLLGIRTEKLTYKSYLLFGGLSAAVMLVIFLLFKVLMGFNL